MTIKTSPAKIRPTQWEKEKGAKNQDAVLVELEPVSNEIRYGMRIDIEHLRELVDAAKNGEFDKWLEGDWNSTTEVNTE